jgi:two-component system NtrC family sensor kinase
VGSETARDIAFCAHGIPQPEVFVVEDARADDRFPANPMVTGGPKIRFYAGAPLTTSDGHALGMLCVNSPVARTLSPEQGAGLQALSRQVVAQLDLRRRTSELARPRDEAVETALAKSQTDHQHKAYQAFAIRVTTYLRLLLQSLADLS